MSIEDMNHPPKVTGPTNGHSEDMMLTRTPSSINSKRHLLMPSAGARLKQIVVVSLLLVGFIVCVTSLVAILLLPSFVSNQISKRLVLKNNSMLLERWSKPNVPMYFKVWVYDIQNAHELALKRDTKPQVKEVGPFVFHLKRQKDIVSFAGDNLYYTERKVYHFSPELSCCAINTTVTIPNIPLVAVVDRALSYNLPLVGRFIPRLINRAIQSLREPLFVRKQVREILFDGYEVELLKMVSRVGAIVGLPQTNEKFALLKGRNDTWRPEQDGVWAINTGASDRKQFGKVSSWNSYKQLPFWASSGCNAINGSDGTLFPPPIKSTEPLYIFNQELCRTVNLVYERPSEVRGIKSLRFALNPMNFAHTMTGNGGPVGVASSSLSSNQLRLRKPTTTTGGLTETAPKVTGSTKPSLLPAMLPQGTGTALSGNDILKTSAATQKQQQVVPMVYHKSNLLPANIDDASSLQANGKRWRFSGASQPSSAQMTTNGMGPPATRAEQERFVLAAQEAQAQAERLPNQRNPFTCFCDRKSTNLNGVNVCEFDGLIDLSKCTKQAQVIFGSMPHFYRGDPRLARQVVGMQPNASRHTTYLDIEPNTGLVLGGKRRVQLNLLIKHNNEVVGFENINDMLVPLVWFEESAQIPEESAQKFKSLYTNRIRLINLILISMLLASIGLIVIDLRLLAASGHWREFKIVKLATANCQQVASAATSSIRKPKHERPAKPTAPTGGSSSFDGSATLKSSSASYASSIQVPALESHFSASRRKDSEASIESTDSGQELTRNLNAGAGMGRQMAGSTGSVVNNENGTTTLPLLANYDNNSQQKDQQSPIVAGVGQQARRTKSIIEINGSNQRPETKQH